jgi:hypothetical protein
MPKINTNNPLSAENAKLAAELAKSKEKSLDKNAAVFRLNLNHKGEIDPSALQKLIETARASKTYQRNKEKYQFTLVSGPKKTQYLALKQQGLWSKFKSLFPFTREARQERRAEAARMVSNSLDLPELKNDVKTRAQAREFQRDVITTFRDEGGAQRMSDLLASELLPAGNGQQHRSDRPVSDDVVGSQKKPDYLKGAQHDPYDGEFENRADSSIFQKRSKSDVTEQGFVNKNYEDEVSKGEDSEDEDERFSKTGNSMRAPEQKTFEQFLFSQIGQPMGAFDQEKQKLHDTRLKDLDNWMADMLNFDDE